MNVQFSAAEKDALARLLLLNSHIDAQNQAYFEWKEPFNTLLIAAKAAHKKEGLSSYDKPSSTMGCSGEAAVNFLESAEKVARFLYEQGSQYCYAIPEVPKAVIEAAEKDIDYIL